MQAPGAINEPNQGTQGNMAPGTPPQGAQGIVAPGTAQIGAAQGTQVPGSPLQGTGLNPGLLSPPATPPSDPMEVLMRAVLSQTQGLQQVVDKLSNAPSTSWSQSGESWGKSLDTKGMLRCDQYHGQKELFAPWKKQFYGTLDMIDKAWSPILKDIEDNQLDIVQLESSWSEEKKSQAKGIETFLVHLCKEDAATRIAAAPDGNGLEAWRLLAKSKLPKSSSAAMWGIMHPTFTSNDDQVNLQQWNKDVIQYESRFREIIPESIKISVYRDKIAASASSELLQHLLLNKSLISSSTQIKDAIESFLEAREESEQARGVTEGFVTAVIDDKSKNYQKDKTKGAKKGKKGVKGKDKDGKGHGTGKDAAKGKDHKGLKGPDRSEARKFGGKCHWCWRIGHKQEQCWFKQAYDQYNKDNPKGDKKDDAQGGVQSQDIKKWMQAKPPAGKMDASGVTKGGGKGGDSGVQAMDVAAILPHVEPQFIFAVLNGDYDYLQMNPEEECQDCEDYWTEEGEEEVPEDAEEQRAAWMKQFQAYIHPGKGYRELDPGGKRPVRTSDTTEPVVRAEDLQRPIERPQITVSQNTQCFVIADDPEDLEVPSIGISQAPLRFHTMKPIAVGVHDDEDPDDGSGEAFPLPPSVSLEDQYVFAIQQGGRTQRPLVDSGAFISCCEEQYSSTKTMRPLQTIKMKTALNEEMPHQGVKPQVKFKSTGPEILAIDFQVTKAGVRPILSVRERVIKHQMVVFSSGISKIIKDPDAIRAIQDIIKRTPGFDIVDEGSAFVLDADLVSPEVTGTIAPVIQDVSMDRALRKAEADHKHEQALVDEQISMEVAIRPSLKATKAPYTPSQEEKALHAATHVPFRSWCEHCVAGKSPDGQHHRASGDQGIPSIEFDYAAGSGKTSDPERRIGIFTATESAHHSQLSVQYQSKGSKDEYTMQVFLNWIKGLGMEKYELKCDQEPSTVDVRDKVIDRCKSTILTPFATPKGSKGSLGQCERAHLSVQGQMRTQRLVLEAKYRTKIGPSHRIHGWSCRHSSWLLVRCQVKTNGKTAYFSMRNKEYTNPIPPFGECVTFKVITEDKYEPRWLPGVWVGRVDQTDEDILLTEHGVKFSRCVKRREASSQYDLEFFEKVKGLPWMPKENLGITIKNDPLVAGATVKGPYITRGVLDKYGRTPGCPKCEEFGVLHSAECKQRIEKLMIDSGEAYREIDAVPVVVAQASSAAAPTSGLTTPMSSGTATPVVMEGMIAYIQAVSTMEEPKVELWRDKRMWKSQKFPEDKLKAGREKEVKNLILFNAIKDTTLEEGEHAYSMVWVEEWRGDEVRSRLVVRQYNTEGKRDDLFAGTPDAFFSRFQLHRASCNKDWAVMIVDVSVAFMHAPIQEKIKVKVPPGLTSATGYWELLKAVNGTRQASLCWDDFAADKVTSWGATRNDHNPAVFRFSEQEIDLEKHGDDFFAEGPRDQVLWLKEKFNEDFLVKKAEVVSLHPEDLKQASFLHRTISVDEIGYHEELEPKYAEDLIRVAGVAQCKGVTTPGYKDNTEGHALGVNDHTNFRSVAGISQYMQERRGDLGYPTKEVLRKCNRPTTVDQLKVTRIAKYVKQVPRCVQTFPWMTIDPKVLDTYVDSDWSGEDDTRKSTSGGTNTLLTQMQTHTELKHWCASQPTVALSSGEAEAKSVVRGIIEGLYTVNLLKQQDYEVEWNLHCDSSAAIGHCSRLGNGKRMRHLEGAELWVQQILKTKKVRILKIAGKLNPADLFTKYLSFPDIVRHMQFLGYALYDCNDVELGCKQISLDQDGQSGDPWENVDEEDYDALWKMYDPTQDLEDEYE